MARRRKNNDEDTARAMVALVVVGGVLGWFEAARTFVGDRLPLFLALAVALLVLAVLIVRRRIAASRRRAAHRRGLDARVASTDGMTGPDFEKLVARLMQRDGFMDVTIPGGAGDLGADVIGTAPDGQKVVVQCKRYGQKRYISSPDMQKFLGTCFHEHGADAAWYVTTTHFSKAARDLGSRRGVRLVDRNALAQWMASSPTSTAIIGATRTG